MREAQLQKLVRDILERAGARVVKTHGDIYMEPGVSDLLVCLRGRYLAIEMKRPGEGPTERQQRFLDEVRRAGGIAAVVSDPEVVRRALVCFPSICHVCLRPLLVDKGVLRCPDQHGVMVEGEFILYGRRNGNS